MVADEVISVVKNAVLVMVKNGGGGYDGDGIIVI